MVDLAAGLDLDLLLVQEIYRHEVEDFAGVFDDAVSSYDVIRSDGHTSGKVGCAVLARREVRLVQDSGTLLYDLPQPERGLLVDAVAGDRPLTVLSWHAPNAVQHGREGKAAGYRAVIRALSGQQGSVVIGMDTNMPHDWPDLGAAEMANSQPEWRFQWDLLGLTPAHPLRDVYRDLREREGTLAEAPQTGPLAQSVLVGTKPERFDRIYATSDLVASRVDHQYQAALAAGSDHALVVAELSWHSALDQPRTSG